MSCDNLLTPRPHRSCHCPGHSCRAEAADRACGHPSTDARHTNGSRGGRHATYPCGVEHLHAAPYVGCSTRRRAKSDAAANARRRAKGWRLDSNVVVMPKVGDLPSMPSVWHVPNRRCPPPRQRRSTLGPTNATRTRWIGL
jgi:hypothetical protein